MAQNNRNNQYKNPVPREIARTKSIIDPKEANVPIQKAKAVVIDEKKTFDCDIKVAALNVRKSPVPDSEIIYTINQSMKAQLVSKSLVNGFYKVTGIFGIGYVVAEYVDTTPDEDSDRLEEETTESTEGSTEETAETAETIEGSIEETAE